MTFFRAASNKERGVSRLNHISILVSRNFEIRPARCTVLVTPPEKSLKYPSK
ncbi:MAG: hypothetical protein ACP5KY_09995 [Thermoproteus sp.]